MAEGRLAEVEAEIGDIAQQLADLRKERKEIQHILGVKSPTVPQKIKEALSGGPLKVAEIAREIGHPKTTTATTINKLYQSGELKRSPGKMWGLA